MFEEKTEMNEQQKDQETRKPRSGGFGKRSRDGQQGRSGGRQASTRGKAKFIFKKKVCYFCKNKEQAIDYKDVGLMKRFIAESCKISPRRFTGTCAKHQRKLANEIKKARQMALIPFVEK